MEAQIDILKSELEKNIESFRSKRTSSRNLAFGLRMFIVSIGTATTIVIGLKAYLDFPNSDRILSALALVLSAMVPIFMAWEAFFDHRWLWVRYTETLNLLYAIRGELLFLAAGEGVTKQQLDLLFDRMQRALSESNISWAEKRTKDAKGKTD